MSDANDRGYIVWLTGLSGAGKSTLADALVRRLGDAGRRVEVLDGDVVRTHLSAGLGFSRPDRDTNVRRIGWVADLVARHGGVAVVAAISPYRAVRDEIKRQYANVVEVFVDAPLDECQRRDVKGLYAAAGRGKVPGMTGVDDPYEPPTDPDVRVDTTACTPEEGAGQILDALRRRGLLGRR